DPLEYLSRNLTIRVTYVSPKVGEHWRTLVPRQRVRLWTQDAAVMKGWQDQMKSGIEPAGQHKLWEWVKDNVDFRVRARKI
ncbi:MAG: hypothetical protein GTO53_13535, partial [Planctomycetales bacterium]|nr:hypothetical protein [Planctomycetales bacterium]NIM10113.1 hypothetical protein [Planctomycetales bacterium]